MTILSLLLSVSGPAKATPNLPSQDELMKVNRHTEFVMAKEDCANQLGITLPPPPNVAQKLDPTSREQMRSCLAQKGFVRKPAQATMTKTTAQ